MTSKQIYRGYDIEKVGGEWVVSKDSEVLARLIQEDSALDFVDCDRREKLAAKARA